MRFETFLIDLDETIYESGNGLWGAIRDRMSDYMHINLGFPIEDIPDLRHSYYEKYGTTLRGLQIHHQVDADDFLAYVHDLPLAHYLHPDPDLRALLESLPQRKFIFTNADAGHASRVIKALNVSDCFDGIIDIRAMGYICKPQSEAYKRALELAGQDDPRKCVYLDDIPKNLAPAHQIGIYTVLVRKESADSEADKTIPSLKDLPDLVPELWEGIK